MDDRSVPRWILGLCVLLVVIGASFGSTLLFAPSKVVTGIDLDLPAAKTLVQGLAGRSLTMALAMALAVWARDPRSLAILLTMRFFTEGQDLITSLLAKGLVVRDVVFIAGVMLLEFVALRSLLAVASREGRGVKYADVRPS